MRFFLVALFFSALMSVARADDYSMRRCVLLPITDGLGGSIGAKVYENVEGYLKENNWCTYQSSSSLLSVFSRYRDKLEQHLKTPQVVKTVADRLQVGSLIRINLRKEVNGLEIGLDVLGSNGEDLYFSEKTAISGDDLDNAAQTVTDWLDVYGKSIPYDGMITGILGEQITLDIGNSRPIKVGQDFSVSRLRGVKKHPLFKKVVEWDSRALAQGKIFNVSDAQALGMVKSYTSEVKLQKGDWVRLGEVKSEMPISDKFPDEEKDSFGKLGVASIYLVASSSSLGASASGNKRLEGRLIGIDARAEAWVTRNWFGLLQFSRSMGTLKKSSGDPDLKKSDYQRGSFKLGGGWKYLPLGFFYGPQIDVYGGYTSQLYKPDVSEDDGLGEFGLSGIFLGVGTNFPVGRTYRGVFRAEFLPFPKFTDDDSVYGSSKTQSWLQLEMGVKYQYNSNITLDGMLEMTSAKATFGGDVKSISAQDLGLKLGGSFNF